MARFAVPALMVILALAGLPAAAAGQDNYLKWDAATNTATFELIAGADGATSPFNFDGYTDGEATLPCLRAPPWSSISSRRTAPRTAPS